MLAGIGGVEQPLVDFANIMGIFMGFFLMMTLENGPVSSAEMQ